jgi:LysM repeat protein
MERQRQAGWQTNLLMTAAVMATVFLALILAQFDALQARMLPQRSGLPIVNIQATAVAVGQVIALNGDAPPGPAEAVPPAADDLNPRPEFIESVSEEGVIFTVCGEVPAGWLLYTVQPGETLASLAAATQATTAELAAANCLPDGQVTAGMQLLVPRQPVAALCGPPQWWVRYQVLPGDTLGALARGRGTTIDEILRANCRDALDLLAGQLIFLPPGFQPGPAVPLPQPSLTPLPTATPPPTAVPPTAPPTDEPPPTQPPPTGVPPTNPPTALPPTVTPPPPPTQRPTDTPEPPTATPEPPTDTPVPPTDTPVPPTDTPEPPTATPEPPTVTPPPPPPTEEPTDVPITPEPPDE